MKKIVSLFLAAVLLLMMTGCTPKPSVKFTNNLDKTVDNMYITPHTDDEWGESLLITTVEPGHTISLTMEKFSPENAPGVFDIGVICHNAMNYDVSGVYLEEGYEIEMSSTGNTASDTVILKVTDRDGNVTTYEGYIYSND